MALWLVCDSPQLQVKLTGRVRIGRTPEHNDVAIPDDGMVSSFHCTIEEGIIFDGQQGSRSANGTEVDDELLEYGDRRQLHPGNVLTLGQTKLRVVTEAELPQPASSSDAPAATAPGGESLRERRRNLMVHQSWRRPAVAASAVLEELAAADGSSEQATDMSQPQLVELVAKLREQLRNTAAQASELRQQLVEQKVANRTQEALTNSLHETVAELERKLQISLFYECERCADPQGDHGRRRFSNCVSEETASLSDAESTMIQGSDEDDDEDELSLSEDEADDDSTGSAVRHDDSQDDEDDDDDGVASESSVVVRGPPSQAVDEESDGDAGYASENSVVIADDSDRDSAELSDSGSVVVRGDDDGAADEGYASESSVQIRDQEPPVASSPSSAAQKRIAELEAELTLVWAQLRAAFAAFGSHSFTAGGAEPFRAKRSLPPRDSSERAFFRVGSAPVPPLALMATAVAASEEDFEELKEAHRAPDAESLEEARLEATTYKRKYRELLRDTNADLAAEMASQPERQQARKRLHTMDLDGNNFSRAAARSSLELVLDVEASTVGSGAPEEPEDPQRRRRVFLRPKSRSNSTNSAAEAQTDDPPASEAPPHTQGARAVRARLAQLLHMHPEGLPSVLPEFARTASPGNPRILSLSQFVSTTSAIVSRSGHRPDARAVVEVFDALDSDGTSCLPIDQLEAVLKGSSRLAGLASQRRRAEAAAPAQAVMLRRHHGPASTAVAGSRQRPVVIILGLVLLLQAVILAGGAFLAFPQLSALGSEV